MPQVRDQVYDEKVNTITIVVVCCSPERIRDKLCSKGGKTIKSIEIKEPKKPIKRVRFDLTRNIFYEPEEKVKEPEKLKDKAKEPKKAKEGAMAAMVATPWISEPMMMMPPVQEYPQAIPGCGCGQCYYNGGPCYQYYGTPEPAQPSPYYGYGPGPDPSSFGYVNNDYYYEENGQGCTIM